jgi:hypothetical protein
MSTPQRRATTTRHHVFRLQKKAFVVWIGAPGVYHGDDPVHDQSWANYVTWIMMEAKDGLLSPDEKHLWVLYEPGYTARWADDRDFSWWERNIHDNDLSDTRFRATQNVLGGSYINHVRSKASEYSAAHGIDISVLLASTAQGFWDVLLREVPNAMLSRVWFFGHARNSLWLSLNHTSAGIAVSPDSSAIISVASIATNAASVAPLFSSSSKPCKFYGCNTVEFAREWHTRFNVDAQGADGEIDFRQGPALGYRPDRLEATASNGWFTFLR